MQKGSLNGLRSKLLKYLVKKQRARNNLLYKYIERLKKNKPRSTILLFGSRARGEQLPYSDYDIAVILEQVDDKLKTVEKLRRLKPRGLDLDLIVFSLKELYDPLVKNMLENALILYNGLDIKL